LSSPIYTFKKLRVLKSKPVGRKTHARNGALGNLRWRKWFEEIGRLPTMVTTVVDSDGRVRKPNQIVFVDLYSKYIKKDKKNNENVG
jgi:hypothetical protein